MNTDEFVKVVKGAVAEYLRLTKDESHSTDMVPLSSFGRQIRRLKAAADRFECPIPRTPYSNETKERPGDSEQIERHESFGLIGISRVQGGARLFGSHLERHHHYITLRIYRAQVIHSSLGYDRYHTNGRVPIVEVAMSAAQFAEAITTLNMGDGVPCTLESVEGFPMEQIPDAVVAENVKIRDGFADKIKATVERAEKARDAFNRIVESGAPFGKGRAKEMLAVLDKVVQDLKANAPFMVEQFQESAEKVVSQAKAEIEAFTNAAVMKAGLERLFKENNPLMRIEGGSAPEPIAAAEVPLRMDEDGRCSTCGRGFFDGDAPDLLGGCRTARLVER